MPDRLDRTPANPEPTDAHAFIVRVWAETFDKRGYPVTIRGSIEHVGTRVREHFSNLDSILRFIQRQVRIQPRPTLQPWRRFLKALDRWL